jgi:hypothetical protein
VPGDRVEAEEHVLAVEDVYDPMGKDAVVFHHSAHSGHPADAPYVEQARAWFTSMWDNLSYEFTA